MREPLGFNVVRERGRWILRRSRGSGGGPGRAATREEVALAGEVRRLAEQAARLDIELKKARYARDGLRHAVSGMRLVAALAQSAGPLAARLRTRPETAAKRVETWARQAASLQEWARAARFEYGVGPAGSEADEDTG